MTLTLEIITRGSQTLVFSSKEPVANDRYYESTIRLIQYREPFTRIETLKNSPYLRIRVERFRGK